MDETESLCICMTVCVLMCVLMCVGVRAGTRVCGCVHTCKQMNCNNHSFINSIFNSAIWRMELHTLQ